MSLNRFRNGQGKQPVRVYDQVKLFNNGSEKFWRNKQIKIESIKTDQISMKKKPLLSLSIETWQKSGVPLRIWSCFDQSLSRSDQNVLEFWQ